MKSKKVLASSANRPAIIRSSKPQLSFNSEIKSRYKLHQTPTSGKLHPILLAVNWRCFSLLSLFLTAEKKKQTKNVKLKSKCTVV